jgi:peptidoglycan/xylan/chitin deacetylase (PgdA/CDA1 family)/uncharacterized caspase-like protein
VVPFLIAAGLLGGCAHRVGLPAPRDPFLRGEALAVVERYRKVIVLLADGAPDVGARVTAKILFEENLDRLQALEQRLRADPAGAEAFARCLLEAPELRPADTLVFRDLVVSLPASAAQARLAQAIEETHRMYQEEMKKLFQKLNTRGAADRRELWEEYLAFLRARYARAAILAEHEAEVRALGEGLRGKEPPWKDDDREIIGRKFPEKTVLLTFDDGPHAKHTRAIAEVLERYGAKGVFFEVGKNVGALPEVTKALLEGGHVVANHTYSHAFLPKLAEGKIKEQVQKTAAALEALSIPAPSLFRTPYGARSEEVLRTLSGLALRNVLWNVDSLDWADPVPASVADRVLSQVRKEGRGILLFHDVQARTVEALPLILDALVQEGYGFLAFDGTGFSSPSRGAVASPKPEPAPALYRESFAAIIGINDYRHWPKLSYAVADARAMKELLVSRFGFRPENVFVLLDREATREGILSLLGDKLADASRVQREDRVLVFFAGHGVTRQLPNGRALGYLVPADADQKNYHSQAISMTNFQDISEAIPAKHLFFVMDACYSGLALTRGSGLSAPDHSSFLREVTRRAARQVLTAGGADEQVADNGPAGHSIFTWTLLQGLEGRADLDGDSVITAAELYAYVGPGVSALSRQTPAFGNLAGSEGGEFVFQVGHEREYLGEESRQLDARAIAVNAELEKARRALEEERDRSEALKRKLAAVQDELPAPASAPASGEEAARAAVDRGMVHFREQRYGDAVQAFEEACRLNPGNARAANNLGFVYFKMGKLEEAVRWFEKTVAIDPGRAIAFANLGDALIGLHRLAEARAAFRRYLELQPQSKLAELVRKRLAEIESANP